MGHRVNQHTFLKQSLFVLILVMVTSFGTSPQQFTVEAQSPEPNTRGDIYDVTGIAEFKETYFPFSGDRIAGEGVSIGVIDLGFEGLDDLVERRPSLEFSENGGNLDLTDRNFVSTTDHGTKVINVIQDIVPGATIYACPYDGTPSGLYTCATELIQSFNVDIINHSAGVPPGPSNTLEDADIWLDTIRFADREEVLWVNSAGNYGYRPIRETMPYDQDMLQFENGRDYYTTSAQPGRTDVAVTLVWELAEDTVGNLAANEIDLQLIVRDENGTELGRSNYEQDGGTSLPYDTVRVDLTAERRIEVRRVDGDESVVVAIYVEYVGLQDLRAIDSIVLPARIAGSEDTGTLSVGALEREDPSDRRSLWRLADYSSRGNLSIVAPGTLMLDGERFTGTSAAAPIVTGSAALLLSLESGNNHLDLEEKLTGNAENSGVRLLENSGLSVVYLSEDIVESSLGSTPDPSATMSDGTDIMLATGGAPSTTPTVTASPEPSPTVPATPIAVALRNINVRSGPGIEFEVITSLSANEETSIRGITEDYAWYQIELEDGETGWIAADEDFVQNVGNPNAYEFVQPNYTCFVTVIREVPVYTGPGGSVRGSLQTGEDYEVVGKAEDANGRLWWQIIPENALNDIDTDYYWIEDETQGTISLSPEFTCNQIPFVSPPPRFVIVTPTPSPTPTPTATPKP